MRRGVVATGLVVLVVLAGAVSAAADGFRLSGKGTRVLEHPLLASDPASGLDETVPPGETVRVHIRNNDPGYAAFTVYISGTGTGGDEVILSTVYRRGSACRTVNGGCVVYLSNGSEGIVADELTVIGTRGVNNSSADVSHCIVGRTCPLVQ